MTDRSIQPVEPADAAAVGELIARAFAALPAAVWLAADPTERVRMLAGQFAILVEHALAYGTVYSIGDRRGVAVWFDRTAPAPEPSDYPRRLAAICGEATPRFETLDGLFEQHHPGDPHHHLALLAVDPAHQGHGLGTAMLDHHHAELDARGVPAYLEASSERNRRLYARHGYEEGTPFHLPDGPPFWPMWRAPKGT